MNALIFAAGLILGGIFTHLWDVDAVAQARADLAGLKGQHSEQLAKEREIALKRLLAAEAHADQLQAALGDTEQRLSDKQKEIQREITRTTTGRVCLDGRTVGLLNSGAADGTATMPAPASKPAAEDAAVATDTDVATWANQAIEQYNACRARLGTLIDWFLPASSAPINPIEQHDD